MRTQPLSALGIAKTGRCKTCICWKPIGNTGDVFDDGYDAGGICKHKSLRAGWGNDDDYSPDMLLYGFSEGGDFWTGPEFGCVHHTAEANP